MRVWLLICTLVTTLALPFKVSSNHIQKSQIELNYVDRRNTTFEYKGYDFLLHCNTSSGYGTISIYFNPPKGIYTYSDIATYEYGKPIVVGVGYKSVVDENKTHRYKVTRDVNVNTIIQSYSVPTKSFNTSVDRFFYVLMHSNVVKPRDLHLGENRGTIYFNGNGLHQVIRNCELATKTEYLDLESRSYIWKDDLTPEIKLKRQMKLQYNLEPYDINITSLSDFKTKINMIGGDTNIDTWVNLKDTRLYTISAKVEGGYLLTHWSEESSEGIQPAFYIRTDKNYVVGDVLKPDVYLFKGSLDGLYDTHKNQYRKQLPILTELR